MIEIASDLVDAKNTFAAWVLPFSPLPNTIRLIQVDAFELWLTGTRISITNDGHTFAESADYALCPEKWAHVCITRAPDGKSSIYINAKLSGQPNQDAGEPTGLSSATNGQCCAIDDYRGGLALGADEIEQRFGRDPLRDRVFPDDYITLPWLYAHVDNEHSQFGEDGLISGILERIGIESAACLEVGAADGITYSNTRRLAKMGWDTLWIEADDRLYDTLIQNQLPSCQCVHGDISSTGNNCLDAILQRHNFKRLDVLSLDIDGQEYDIWQSLCHRARIVIIEHSAEFPELTVEPRRDKINQVSWKAIEALAETKGYAVVARTPCNSVCVAKDEVAKLIEPKTSVPPKTVSHNSEPVIVWS